jgi:hypothetical protein
MHEALCEAGNSLHYAGGAKDNSFTGFTSSIHPLMKVVSPNIFLKRASA